MATRTDDDLERELLLQELTKPKPPAGGMQAPVDPATTPIAGAPPAEPPAALGAFAGQLEGFDRGKLDAGHDSPKYQVGRVLSRYDPRGGLTQAMLDELNTLGLGEVTGTVGGDKIAFGGQVDPRFQGVTEFDVIRDLETGGGWQWGGLTGGAAAGGGGARPGGAGLTPAAGSSLEGIQGLMPTDTDFYRRLQEEVARTLGGAPALERDQLLKLLGA